MDKTYLNNKMEVFYMKELNMNEILKEWRVNPTKEL